MTLNELQKKTLSTPCFIFDYAEFECSVKGFRQALASQFRLSSVGYSVKTNSLPYTIKEAKALGCLAEVVSHDEYELAKECGFTPSEIIYNGPMKSQETFLEAVKGGGIVNIETHRELQWLHLLPTDKQYEVGLRLNINISEVSPDDADGKEDNSRFGFSDETKEFVNAIHAIAALKNVRLAGLHIHRTAHSRSLNFYHHSVAYACQVIQKYNLDLDYLDVGGGYFGIFPNKPTFQEYSETFAQVLSKNGLSHLHVIVEPGNALVASCFSFMSEVIDVKHVEKDRWFVTTDGSRNDVDPFFHKTGYLFEILSEHEGEVAKEQNITGCTCLEYDRLFTITNKPLLQVGDRILYNNVGAYTMCLSPLFIRYFPSVYVIKPSNKVELVRRAWSAQEYLQGTIQ